MGKLVKYCSSCEEGFAERFGFCPNCGGQLEAFEMKPVEKAEDFKTETVETKYNEQVTYNSPSETIPAATVIPMSVPETVSFSDDDILELDSVDTRDEIIPEKESVKETKTFVAPTVAASRFQTETFAANNLSSNHQDYDDGYHITVVSEKPNNWFRPFLLGLMGLAFLSAVGVWALAVWMNGLEIPELASDEMFYSTITDDEPVETEEEIIKPKGKKGGGGGGGGNENENEASKGRIPTHSDVPNKLMIVPRFDSDLKINNTVNSKVNKVDDGQVVGGGNGDVTSGGRGKGGGIGNGVGTGVGNGIGGGVGNGRGNGTGNGIGNGIGNNIGDGIGDDEDTPQLKKVEKVGETKALAITGKPRPNYTDAARQNNVQGTVTLRVTFNANGTIGAVTPVNSLPYGLTEQAISAAKRMTFQPATKNGQPYAVTKQVAFTFTIY